jgi:putative peptide zinc metalloprotease protein
MADTLFSPSWYRVANLTPRLRSHVRVHRHDYRGDVWYVLQDLAGGRSHRLTPAGYRLVGLMDGRRTVQKLWEATNDHVGDDAPTQDEVIRLLGQLHSADSLICDVPPDGQELFRRFQRHERQRWRQRLWTPLAIRIPLFDPDRFLERTLFLVRPLFSWFGVVLWLVVVGIGAVLAGVHWTELTENIVDRVLAPQNLLLLWLTYPLVKALHELGHGYATKVSGGEVHEIGIMFLVLIPVPYVDASAASGFRSKYRRMTVGAIGIAVELFLGALALFVWLNAEIGAIHAVAYNVMLISGVSSLLFNGNPLLRFDGYYVLGDALEIPNLGTRSNKYLGYLAQRLAFGARDAESPAESNWERFWFVIYGIAAFFYRLFILFVIILYIGSKFFAVGVALAIWATVTQVIVPMGKGIWFLFTNHRLRRHRARALAVAGLTLAGLGLLLFVVPAPLWTRAEGVVWPSEKSQVRMGVDGFIVRLLADGGSEVKAGQPLIEAEEPFLGARVNVLEARLRGLRMQLSAARITDRVRAAVIGEEVAAVSGDLERARERIGDLVVRSPRDGRLVIPNEEDLPGRFAQKGTLVAYVVDPADDLTARAIVAQDEIGLVRQRTREVEVMTAHWGASAVRAAVLREVPGGTLRLPTAALGTAGGGLFAIDPRDGQGLTTVERVFEIEIGLPAEARTGFLGQRVYVRFDHGYEPVGFQVYRALRQLFIRVFGV